MSNENFTQLPVVGTAQLSDIFAVVQANITSQETAQQLFNLMLKNTILSFPGNPNGNVAGVTYQFCWDSTNGVLYVCTVTGISSAAVWVSIAGNRSFLPTTIVTATTQQILPNKAYIANNVSFGITFTLPVSANVGDQFIITGDLGANWVVAQNALQKVYLSSHTTTPGTGGSITSSNTHDSATFMCIEQDLVFSVINYNSVSGLVIV